MPYSNISYGQTINEDEYIRDPETKKPLRPEQKRLSLYEDILDMFYTPPENSSSSSLNQRTPSENVLVEPYSGTGTGLVAGLLRNMKVLGIERDSKCVSGIQRRIKDKVGFRLGDEDFRYISAEEMKKFQENEKLLAFRKNIESFYTQTKMESPFQDYSTVVPGDLLKTEVKNIIVRLESKEYALFYRLVADYFDEGQKRDLDNSRKIAVIMYSRELQTTNSQRTALGVQVANGEKPPTDAVEAAPTGAPAAATANLQTLQQPRSLTSPAPVPNINVGPGGSVPPHLPPTNYPKAIPLVPFNSTVGKFSARNNPIPRSISPQVSVEQQVASTASSTSTTTHAAVPDPTGSIRILEQQILKAPDGTDLEPVDLSKVQEENNDNQEYDVELPNFSFQ